MLEIDFAALSPLGLTPVLASRALLLDEETGSADAAARRLMRVTAVHRETIAVQDSAQERSAQVSQRLARSLWEAGAALAVGDWVLAAADGSDALRIVGRVPPASHIARRDADGRRHPVVSNVDVALLVMGLDDDFNPRRIERFLALVQDDAITPVIVLTKADVVASMPGVLDERVALLRARLPARFPLVAVDATGDAAAFALADYLEPGRTLVLLGSSGAGKSTLTNTLLGAHVQDTGAVRTHDSRGKHTTTSRTLHRLPGGACVIDTPGLRTLRPDADAQTLADSFTDIAARAAQCRFRDCGHDEEPGCAVRDAVDPDRLRNYRKLLREMRRDTLTPLDRQRQVAQWKARGKAAKARMRQKREGM